MVKSIMMILPTIALLFLVSLFTSDSGSVTNFHHHYQQGIVPLAHAQSSSAATMVATTPVEEMKTIVICHITWMHRVSTASAAHAHHTVNLRAPNKTVKFEYMLVYQNGNVDQRDTILSYLNAPSNCSVILGPSTSFQSLAISPIVDKPWISDTASSTELSNKDSHPWFSRATPTNIDIGGAAGEAAARMFGWKQTAVLCGDDSYGRSLGEGFSSAIRRNGGRILSSECIAQTTQEEIEVALDRIEKLETRVVFVTAYPEDMIVEEILARGLDKKIIWILHEVACQEGSPTVEKLPGAICPEYGLVQDRYDAYRDVWLQHPAGLYTDLFSDSDNFVPLPTEYTIHSTAALASDSAEFFMQAFEDAYFVNCSSNVTCFNQLTNADMLDILRRTSHQGMTGPFQMLPNGDRIGAVMTINNIQPNKTVKIIGSYNSVDGISDYREPGEKLYFLNTGFMDTPEAVVLPAPEDEIPTLLVVGLFIGAIILILFFVAVYKLRNATKEVYMKIIRSGANWVLLSSILAAFADFMTDCLACYHVWISDYELVFQLFYTLLTILSLIVSFIDLQLMIRFFIKSLEAGSLNDMQIADWKLTIQKAHCLSLVAEDLPMVVLAIVANQQNPNTFLIISVIFSCTAIGWKAEDVPAVLRSFRDTGVSDKDLPLEMHKTMGMMSVATVEPFDRYTDPDTLEQFAAYVAESFPSRSNTLVAKAEQMSIDLVSRKVTRAEFFSIVNPVLMSRFEDDGEDNSKAVRNAGGIPEGSIMTREDMAASKLMVRGGGAGGGGRVVKASSVAAGSGCGDSSGNHAGAKATPQMVDWSPMMGLAAEEDDRHPPPASASQNRGSSSGNKPLLRPADRKSVTIDVDDDVGSQGSAEGGASRKSASAKSISGVKEGRRSFQVVINDHQKEESKDGPAFNVTSPEEKNPLSPGSSRAKGNNGPGITFVNPDASEENPALVTPSIVGSAGRRRSSTNNNSNGTQNSSSSAPQQQQQQTNNGGALAGTSSSSSSRRQSSNSGGENTSSNQSQPHHQDDDVFDMAVESIRHDLK